MLKSSLFDQKKILCENPWVQSPLWLEVEELLAKICVKDAYLRRGSRNASRQFKDLEQKHRQWILEIIDLKAFPHCYVVAGATEAINQWRLTDPRPWQYLKGEYQWPQIVSKNGLQVEIDSLRTDHVLYLSNPSCRDGNFLTSAEIEKINRSGCPIILDCAYVGATDKYRMQIPHNVEQIFFSFSKGWGVIGQRAGLLYSAKPHQSLQHMLRVECWNYQTVHIMNALVEKFSVSAMYKMGVDRQMQLCRGVDLKPSHTYFLATSNDVFFEKQRRSGEMARLCLTPLWTNLELSTDRTID